MAEAATPKKKIEEVPEKLHVWPYLVRLEFLCALIITIALKSGLLLLTHRLKKPLILLKLQIHQKRLGIFWGFRTSWFILILGLRAL